MVDFLVILVVLFAGLWGYLRGILRGVLSLVSLGVAYRASAALAPVFGSAISRGTDWPDSAAQAVGRVAGALLIYVSLSVSAHVADRKFGHTKVGTVRRWNRSWGAAAGLLSGLMVAAFLLLAGDVLLKAFPEAGGSFVKSARSSSFMRLASRVNPADRYLVTDTLKLLRAAHDDPEVMVRLSKREGIRSLLEVPEVKALSRTSS